jgi:hypothetical protein
MGKLIQIKDGEQRKTFEVECAPDALYFNFKCYSSHQKEKYRIIHIKLSDVIYQIFTQLTPEERTKYCLDIGLNKIR